MERGQRTPELSGLLRTVLALGASDLHLTSGSPPVIRRHGRLVPLPGPLLTPGDVGTLVAAMLDEEHRTRLQRERELDFAYALADGARFRVNAYEERGHPAAALRAIPAAVRTLPELGLPPVLAGLTCLPRGFVVVAGPTGSGKSTTLAAMIDAINSTRPVHIITIEDPIEFLHGHRCALISQREVGADTASFGQGLRSVLRQDPDVILIGELRDTETMATALTAAVTGHLVFATLHTQDAPQTVDRIIDAFPSQQQGQIRVQLAATLMGVCCQQLIPASGDSGQVAACEILIPTPAARNLIREGKTHQLRSIIQPGGAVGMQPMEAALAELVRRGRVTRAAALSRCGDPEGLEQLLGPATSGQRQGP